MFPVCHLKTCHQAPMEKQKVFHGQLHSSVSMQQDSGTTLGFCPSRRSWWQRAWPNPAPPKHALVQLLADLVSQWEQIRKACIIKAGKPSISLTLTCLYFEASLVFYKLWEAVTPSLVCFKGQPDSHLGLKEYTAACSSHEIHMWDRSWLKHPL